MFGKLRGLGRKLFFLDLEERITKISEELIIIRGKTILVKTIKASF